MQHLLNDIRRTLATPSRNPRMAVVIGRLLATAFLVCFLTGLFSHFLQDPLPWMRFPTRPIWLYQVSQGMHITSGILCFPLLLAKLYVVYPDLFQTPPVRSFAHVLERASIALFVAASLFEITIGLLNTFQFYSLFPFSFRNTHFAVSFVVIGSLAIHIAVKLSTITRYWRKADSYDGDGHLIEHDVPEKERELQDIELARVESVAPGTPGAATSAPADETGGVTGRVFAWIDRTPSVEPRTSRRGFLATVAVTAATLVAFTAGQSYRVLDFANIFGPRKNDVGPGGLPVNRTARAAKVLDSAMSPDWQLTVSNAGTTKTFTRDDLAALDQYEVTLPIACVEGWSQYAVWRGPRMRDIADSVGASSGVHFRATSLEKDSIYAVMEMGPEFVRDDLTLVALEVDGQVLDIDHGYPARMIAPSRPGVLQTKWLSTLEVI